MTRGGGLVPFAALVFASGCSFMGMFDERPVDDEGCLAGVTRDRVDACGTCGRGTLHQVCGSDGRWRPRDVDPCSDPDDGDGDDFPGTDCAPPLAVDCDDGDPEVHPEADETCNDADDDCDTETDEGFDCRIGATEVCTTTCGSDGSRTCSASCVWNTCIPPAEASCNGADDDCDGDTDEGDACVPGEMVDCTTTCGSAGVGACSSSCAVPSGGGCPLPLETCGNGEDDDCDTETDEADCEPCPRGAVVECTTSCGTTGFGTCSFERQPPTVAECTPPVEACGNGEDDDCDGETDETDTDQCTPDSSVSCTTVCGTTGTGTCTALCQPPDPDACTPPEEKCDGSDDDCDGETDETFPCSRGMRTSCTTTCGSTGSGICTSTCAIPGPSSCTILDETCNGEDDDCDSATDEGIWCWVQPWYGGGTFYSAWIVGSDDVWAVGENGIALHWDGTSWTKTETGVTETLWGVVGFSPDDVWAVGGRSEGGSGADVPLLRWDGDAWSQTRLTMPGGADPVPLDFCGLWGTSADDIWAVGQTVTGVGDWYAAHRDATGWTLQGPLDFDDDGSRTACRIWGTSADDFWVLPFDGSGGGGMPFVPDSPFRWDGDEWTPHAVPSGGVSIVNDLWGLGTGEILLSGYRISASTGYLFGWDEGSSSWHTLDSFSGFNPGLVRGLSADDTWVVGIQDWMMLSEADSVINAYDGSDVAPSTADPRFFMPVQDIRVRTTDDAWAVGGYGGILRWNGSVWAQADGVPVRGTLWSAAGSPSGTLVLSTLERELAVWDGTDWTVAEVPGDDFLADVWVAPTGEVWGVTGVPGTTPHDLDASIVRRWDGSDWQAHEVRLPGWTCDGGFGVACVRWTSVFGFADDDVWVAGQAIETSPVMFGAVVARWNGDEWSIEWAPSSVSLAEWGVGIWGSSSNDVWITEVPSGGITSGSITHWNGSEWALVDVGSCWPDAVWGTSDSDIWAVGPAGCVLHWNGDSWTPDYPTEDTTHWNWVGGSAAEDVWVASDHGVDVRHWNGSTWEDRGPSIPGSYRTAWVSPEGHLWLFGDAGTMIRYVP